MGWINDTSIEHAPAICQAEYIGLLVGVEVSLVNRESYTSKNAGEP